MIANTVIILGLLATKSNCLHTTRSEVGSDDQYIELVSNYWDTVGLEALMDAIRIPSLSTAYDDEWESNGHLAAITQLYEDFSKTLNIPGIGFEYLTLGDGDDVAKPPVMLVKIPGTDGEGAPTALLYSHCDVQPPLDGQWEEGYFPYEPVLVERDGNQFLYGRGSVDDKYAFYSSLFAIKSLLDNDVAIPNIYLLVDLEEESGSPNLYQYLLKMRDELNITPDFAAILDSGGLNNEHFFNTNSLRGVVSGVLSVDIGEAPSHSGTAGGILPSPYRIMNHIIGKYLEEIESGDIIFDAFNKYNITPAEYENAENLAQEFGDDVWQVYNFVEGATINSDGSEPTIQDVTNTIIRNTLMSQLTILDMEHLTMPDLGTGGNVIQGGIKVTLSIRTDPDVDVDEASEALKNLFENEINPIYNASVKFDIGSASPGFSSGIPSEWLAQAIAESSQNIWGTKDFTAGIGGTIPFVSLFQDVYPSVEILNCGVIVTASNIHAPMENLDYLAAKRITALLSNILEAMMTQK